MVLRLATRLVGCMAAVSDGGGQSPEPTIHRLTVAGARNGQGFWSRDGRSIAFVSNRTGAWQVWIMSATGSDARQLTNSERPVGWPSWAPDGRSIVYYADTPTGSRCFRIPVTGGSAEPFHHEDFRDFRPLLNHDGTQLLFDRFGATTPANHDLFVRRLRDNSVRQLTNDPGYDSDARWSPDGRSIVWHSDRGSATRYHTQIY